MTSFSERFGVKKGSSEVTSKQIYDVIKGERPETVAEVLKCLPDDVMEEFVSNKNRLKEDKFRKFKRQIGSLLGEYSLSDLIKISPDCIKNDGKIILSELNKILDEEDSFPEV